MIASGDADDNALGFLILVGIFCALAYYFRRWRPAGTAFGVACFARDRLLRSFGYLGERGLVIARTLGGTLIRLPRYTHVLLVGGSGSGKGVGILFPILLSYRIGSVVCFDCKGDLFVGTASRRRVWGERVFRLAPFADGHKWNVLDTIPAGDPMLVDHAAAMAESLVVRSGTNEPHWDDKAAQIIKAVLIFVLLRLTGDERNLNSVQDIASDFKLLAAVGDKLIEMGGIPARSGHHVKGLFDADGLLTKEGSGVASTIARHLGFLDSEMVARSVATSDWDVASLLRRGTTLYLQIPPSQLQAQQGLLRCWISTLIRVIGAEGSEGRSEVLMLLDEASALSNLAAVEEALVRGRSAGVRMLLVFQSDSQVKAAFKDKPTLLYDNCSAQIYLKTSGYETAERLSKCLGEWTQVVDSYGENAGRTWGSDGGPGGQRSAGSSMNYAQQARSLLKPEEILTLSGDYLLALIGDLPAPLLARRLTWYADPAFNPDVVWVWRWDWDWKTVFIIVGLVVLAVFAVVRTLTMGQDGP